MKALFAIFIVNVLFFTPCLFGQGNLKIQPYDTLNYSGQVAYTYYFTEATKQKIFGNYNHAINLFLECIKIKQDCAAVYYQLSDIYAVIGEKRIALNFARFAYKLDKKNIWYQLNLAQMFQENNKIDSTIFIYQKIVKSSPKYEFLYNLAIFYLKENRFKQSLRILNNLERNYGLNKDLVYTKYRLYVIQNDDKSAIKILIEGIASFPGETRFYGLLAEHYASLNEVDLALEYYRKLLIIDPENEKGILSLLEFYKSNNDNNKTFELIDKFICNENISIDCKKEMLVSILKDQRNYENYRVEIKSIIEDLVSLAPDDMVLNLTYIEFFIKTNNLQRAKDELLFIVNSVKINCEVWEKLFYVLNSLNEYRLILDLSDDALSYFEKEPRLYLYKGIAAYQVKSYEVARKALSSGVNLIDNSNLLSLQFYTFLGEVYNAINGFDSSDFYFEKALEIDKRNIYVLNNYSYYLALRKDKLNKAEEYIKRCLDLEPGNYNYLDTYSWILFNSGLIEGAKEKSEQAILHGGSASKNVLEHYAAILVKLNMKDEAYKCYKLIREMGKDSPFLKQLLMITD